MDFFTDKETAKAYEINTGFEADRTVTVIGMFSGPLSKIPVAAADKAFKQGTNLFARKIAPNANKVAQETNTKAPADTENVLPQKKTPAEIKE